MRNGQALLGILDIDVLNIISININTIDIEDSRDALITAVLTRPLPKCKDDTGNIHSQEILQVGPT